MKPSAFGSVDLILPRAVGQEMPATKKTVPKSWGHTASQEPHREAPAGQEAEGEGGRGTRAGAFPAVLVGRKGQDRVSRLWLG